MNKRLATRIVARGIELNDAERQRIADQLWHSLGRFADSVASVDVFLDDENGPKGGVDKHARIRLSLYSGDTLISRSRRSSLRAALLVGSRRSRRQLRRHLKKQKRRANVSANHWLPEYQ